MPERAPAAMAEESTGAGRVAVMPEGTPAAVVEGTPAGGGAATGAPPRAAADEAMCWSPDRNRRHSRPGRRMRASRAQLHLRPGKDHQPQRRRHLGRDRARTDGTPVFTLSGLERLAHAAADLGGRAPRDVGRGASR